MNKKDKAVVIEILDQAPIATTQEVSIDIEKGDGVLDPLTGFITWRKTLEPSKKIVKGFVPTMPTFQGNITEDEIKSLTEFIKSLK